MASYGFIKLVDYGLLFWLPDYLESIVKFESVILLFSYLIFV